ncbi:MAG TPA: FUSC family protein [Acidimicrobiales bacterium]|nr:FUSC family protein [Acidimicrobiales bacterium]
MATVFALNKSGFNFPRAVEVVAVLLLPLVVLGVLDMEKYWLSVAFAILFVGLSDPGGTYGVRVRAMGWVALLGAFITGLGFALGGGPWGWVVITAFAVTFLSGLALRYGVHRYESALMLDAWFLVCIAVPAGQHLDRAHSGWSSQALAWLAGAAFWIALTFVASLIRGSKAQPSHFPEIPTDMAKTTLSRPVVLFTLIKAVAVAIAVAIAFGFHLPNADWMPIATLAALKGTLDQSALAAEQRLIGALIGAGVATVFLLSVDNVHVLEAVIIVLAALAGSVRSVNYAIYCAAMASLVLIATDLSHPTDLTAEFHRVLFTFAGVGIAWLVMLLVDQAQKRTPTAVA